MNSCKSDTVNFLHCATSALQIETFLPPLHLGLRNRVLQWRNETFNPDQQLQPNYDTLQKRKAAETDAKVKAAIEGLSKGVYSTPFAAAQALQLSRATLQRRLGGGKSRTERKENQQNLTHGEEQALARWITRLTATGHPARHCFIKEIAEEIRWQRYLHSATPVSYPNLGNAWVP